MEGGGSWTKWLILIGSVWGFIIGIILIVFRDSVRKYFYVQDMNYDKYFTGPRWLERFRLRSEFETRDLALNIGIGSIVAGVIIFVIFLISL